MNLLGTVLAALSMFLIGGLWYAPAALGRVWARAGNFDPEAMTASRGRTFGLSLLLALVMATALSGFVPPEAGPGGGALAGLLAGLGWVAPAFGMTYSFEHRPLALWAVDAGYHVVAFVVMGLVLGLTA